MFTTNATSSGLCSADWAFGLEIGEEPSWCAGDAALHDVTAAAVTRERITLAMRRPADDTRSA